MRRWLLACVMALIGSMLVAAPASAGQSSIYHTIVSDLGYAVVSQTDGCTQVVVYVSSSFGQYASQPGPVGKQGLTAVDVRVSDVCAVVAAAAGGGGILIQEYQGQAAVPLVADPRLRWARVVADVPATDSTGRGVVVSVDATWTGVGALDHSTGHEHQLFPAVGVVNGTGNDLSRAAEALVTVHLDGQPLVDAGVDPAAVLQQTKWHCIEVPRPGVEDFSPCFGW
jgi:hypothetical protein